MRTPASALDRTGFSPCDAGAARDKIANAAGVVLTRRVQFQFGRTSVLRHSEPRTLTLSSGRISVVVKRLVQTPDAVRDYIILHELMHLRQMNHSPQFWAEVQKVCAHYQSAERWLKANADLLQ